MRVLPVVCGVTPGVSQNQIEVTVEMGSPKLQINGSSAELHLSSDNSNEMASDAVFLVSKLLEKSLNENGIFSAHASAVSFGKNGILLLGPSGAGKTTTAIYSCLDNKSIKYVTGNRAFLDSKTNKIIQGIPDFSLRSSSVFDEYTKFNLSQRLNLSKNTFSCSQKLQNFKMAFSPSQFGIEVGKVPLNLRAILLVRKMNSNFVKFEPEKSGKEELMNVYSSLCEFSEILPSVIVGAKLHYPDIFDAKIKTERLNFAESLVKTIPVIYAEGRLSDLSKFIGGLLRRV
jgi:hypothetical protein